MKHIQNGLSLYVTINLILFLCPIVLGYVLYERKESPNREGDGVKIVEVFRTNCEPPTKEMNSPAIQQFLVGCEQTTTPSRNRPEDHSNDRERMTSFRSTTMQTTTPVAIATKWRTTTVENTSNTDSTIPIDQQLSRYVLRSGFETSSVCPPGKVVDYRGRCRSYIS